MNRPVLSIQTVYFDNSDRSEAVRWGNILYERLTRPASDPLAYGAGIPVRVGVAADHVDLAAADTVVLVVVLGNETYGYMADEVVRTSKDWHARLGPGHVLLLPMSQNWRGREDMLPSKLVLTQLYGKGDRTQETVGEIILAVTRLWEPGGGNVQLFISHSKADLGPTEQAADLIHQHVVTSTTGKAFFDARDLKPGESLAEQLDDSVTRGVLISVRGDAYSSRVWCQRELLRAKFNRMPTLSVEVLRHGEARSSPYGGNSPSMVWNGDASRIVSQAMVEWLRSLHFLREADRIIAAANLPDDVEKLARPPELLDLAQGPLRGGYAQLVLHPDPELSVVEKTVLRAARSRLHLATPTTAFRKLLRRQDGEDGDRPADVTSPLEGMQIAMSLSESPDAGGRDGFTSNHLIDATVHIARTLISSGAAIAYGGNLWKGAEAFTPLLAQLIQTYNQTATRPAKDLHSYLAAMEMEDAPENLPLKLHHLGKNLAAEALLPKPSLPGRPPEPFYYSDMRRVMENHVAARVVMGGKADPRTVAGARPGEPGAGYGGRYPGVVEEAWRSLEKGIPLYVAGGFGGAAAMVADLLEGKEIPEKLRDKQWTGYEVYMRNAAVLDAHPARKVLGLPKSLDDLAKKIAKLGKEKLVNDEVSRAWNGLTVDENKLLFRSRDPVTLAALISKGLLGFVREGAREMLQIELVHGSLTDVERLDAVAIATIDGVPLGGAGAAVDRSSGGRVSEGRNSGRTMVSLRDSLVDAEWLFLASLGGTGDVAAIEEKIEKAAEDTARIADRYGFRRVGIVSFGGTVLPDVDKVSKAMLKGFTKIPNRPVFVWHETDEARFDALRGILEKAEDIKLTTRRVSAPVMPVQTPPESIVVHVRLENDTVSVTCLPPSSAATVSNVRSKLTAREIDLLAEGEGRRLRATPDLATLERKGGELARLLFGNSAASILSLCDASRMIVLHNAAASKIPFELLLGVPDRRPALGGGITRRLEIEGLSLERQFPKPTKKDKLKILLISNPTNDLPGASLEAQAVREILELQKDRLELKELPGADATVENVSKALMEADILHYCGHAFFDGPGPEESGLLLHGKVPFTGVDLARINPLPGMAFVNACEAGRVRGEPPTNAAAFAELFLHSGIEAYLGTFWEVGDDAAKLFAETVYVSLAGGDTLEKATLRGRNVLFKSREPDWANYMLYGGGDFRLVTGR